MLRNQKRCSKSAVRWWVSLLIAKGVTTLGKLAFASSYQPGISADDSELRRLSLDIFGEDGEAIGTLASFRRLYFIAFSLCAAEVHREAVGTSEAPKKLAPAERTARKNAQQARLRGLRIQGNHEPSDALVDTYCEMYDNNRVKWVPWERYTKQSQELLSEKGDTALIIDSMGAVKQKTVISDPDADLSNDLLVYFALCRRGLALEQSRLMNYLTHALWVDELFEHRLKAAPSGYSRVTLQQLREADKMLWVKLAETNADGIRMNNDGTSPLEAGFRLYMMSADVQTRLVPLQFASATSLPSSQASASTPQQRPHREPLPRKRPGQGSAQPKAQVKRARGDNGMPAELKGGVPVTDDNIPICFGFNTGRCPYKAELGTRCPRGLHVCCHPKCFKKHTFKDHK